MELTQEYLKECFDYDPETGLLTWRIRPMHHFKTLRHANCVNARCAGKLAGTHSVRRGNRVQHLVVRVNKHLRKVHIVIWIMKTGRLPNGLLDHRDNNPTNNRWRNLREATIFQNQENRGLNRNNSTGFKGVSRTPSNRYVARIDAHGKHYHLGTYDAPEQAAARYMEAAMSLHGEFARTE